MTKMANSLVGYITFLRELAFFAGLGRLSLVPSLDRGNKLHTTKAHLGSDESVARFSAGREGGDIGVGVGRGAGGTNLLTGWGNKPLVSTRNRYFN